MAKIKVGTRGKIDDPAHSDWHGMRCEITALAPNDHYDIRLLETSKDRPSFLCAGGQWSIKRSQFTADAEAR